MRSFRGAPSTKHETSLDNFWFDEVMPDVTPEEWKVICYIARRTYGWFDNRGRKPASISLNQMATGLVTKDGKAKDGGTGMSRDRVKRALKTLREDGAYIVTVRNESPKYGHLANAYRLRFEDDPADLVEEVNVVGEEPSDEGIAVALDSDDEADPTPGADAHLGWGEHAPTLGRTRTKGGADAHLADQDARAGEEGKLKKGNSSPPPPPARGGGIKSPPDNATPGRLSALLPPVPDESDGRDADPEALALVSHYLSVHGRVQPRGEDRTAASRMLAELRKHMDLQAICEVITRVAAERERKSQVPLRKLESYWSWLRSEFRRRSDGRLDALGAEANQPRMEESA